MLRIRRNWSSKQESVEAVQKGAPAKAQRSGFGGERRSNGMTELLPRKAKRRIWSLRRRDGPKSRKLHYGEYVGPTHVSPPNPRIKARFQRAALEPFGTPFSPIFRRATKDGVPEGCWKSRAVGEKRATKDIAPGGRRLSREVGKKRTAKDIAVGDRRLPNAAGKNE